MSSKSKTGLFVALVIAIAAICAAVLFSRSDEKSSNMKYKSVLFWNVDTQKDFMNSGGALYVQDAEQIKPKLKAITQFARENGIQVVNTADWHYADSKELSETPDFVTTFNPHCMAQSPGAEFIEETAPENPKLVSWEEYYSDFDTSSRNFVVLKDAFNVFDGNPNTDNLLEALSDKGIETVYVYGVASNVCVKEAAEGLAERDFEVVVFEDAVKGLPGLPDPLSQWKQGGKIRVMKFDDFIAEVE